MLYKKHFQVLKNATDSVAKGKFNTRQAWKGILCGINVEYRVVQNLDVAWNKNVILSYIKVLSVMKMEY